MKKESREEMLKGAGLVVSLRHAHAAGRQVYELSSVTGGFQAFVSDAKFGGLTVGLRIEIPQSSPLLGLSRDDERSLLFLGRLVDSLQTRDLSACLVIGERGLQAVMITGTAGADVTDAPKVKALLELIESVAGPVRAELNIDTLPTGRAIASAAQTELTLSRKPAARTAPFITASADPVARAQMVARSTKLKQLVAKDQG